MRDLPIRILEIGVLDGRSLASWADYFPNAKVYGLDIDPDCVRFESGRTHIFTGGQTDSDLLARVRNEVPEGFDIIIDDGSHYVDHVITTFGELFPHLRPNGIYVVEDLKMYARTCNGERSPGIKAWTCIGNRKETIPLAWWSS